MGQDAYIYFRAAAEQELTCALPHGIWWEEASPKSRMTPEGANFKIVNLDRFYGHGCTRGDWCRLCSVLMNLLENPEIETVWYGSDYDETIPVCTIDLVLDLSRKFMEYRRQEE